MPSRTRATSTARNASTMPAIVPSEAAPQDDEEQSSAAGLVLWLHRAEAMVADARPPALLGRLETFSEAVTRWVGSSSAFFLAAGIIIVWLLLGPLFHFSDTWQLVINTTTTIVTFLMVFLIQRSQNKEALAIHLKLNEIV